MMKIIAVLVVWPLFFVSALGLVREYLRLPTDGSRHRRATRRVVLLAICTLVTGAAFGWLCYIVASEAIS